MLEISRSVACSFLGSWTPACNKCPVLKQMLAELRSDHVRCNIFPSMWLTTHGRDCARPMFRRGRLTSSFDLIMFTDSVSSASLALSSSSSIDCLWFSCFLNSARANTDFFAGSNTWHLRRQMCWGQWGAIHKGRPHKSTIFYPLPPPCPHLSTFGIPLPPPPYRTSAMPFHFKEISLKLLCYL